MKPAKQAFEALLRNQSPGAAPIVLLQALSAWETPWLDRAALERAIIACHACGIAAATEPSSASEFAEDDETALENRIWYQDALEAFKQKGVINGKEFDSIAAALESAKGILNDPELRQRLYDQTFTMVREGNQAIIENVASTLRKTIRKGGTAADLLHDINDVYKAAGIADQQFWYSELVYNNAANRAYQEGIDAGAAQMAEDGTLWGYEWQHSGSENPRPSHKALNGWAAPADDPRWAQIGTPPIGHNCACRRFPVTHWDARRRKLDQSPPTPVVTEGPGAGKDALEVLDTVPGERFGRSDWDTLNRPLLNPSYDLPQSKYVGPAPDPSAAKKIPKPAPKPVAPPEPPPISSIPAGVDGAEDFGKRLTFLPNEQLGGSTGARAYIDDEGAKWVVKDYSGNEIQVRNEFIANRLYQENGINVAEGRLAIIDGRVNFANRMIDEPGLVKMGSTHVDWCAETAAIKKGFVTDAWVANWDVAGTGWDNVLCVPGKKTKVFRVDQGGSLLFRAQGAPKGAAFGPDVLEIKTLRDPIKNEYSTRLFQHITDKDISAQITTLKKAMTPTRIDAILAEAGLTGSEGQVVSETLKARLTYLTQWQKDYKAAQKAARKAAKAATATAKKQDVLPGNLPADRITPEEVRIIKDSRGNGYAVPIDAEDIEDQQILFWIEKNASGKQTVNAMLKLRPEAGANKTLMDMVNSAGGAFESDDLFKDMLRAVKGIAYQASQGGVIRPIDLDHATAAAKALLAKRQSLEAAVKKGLYSTKTIDAFDAHYKPWMTALENAVSAGAGGQAKWIPPAPKFQAMRAVAAKQATKGLQKADSTFLRTRISKGNMERTNDAAISWGKEYQANLDGVEVRYWAAKDDTSFALRDQVWLSVEGENDAAATSILETLGKLGITNKRPSPLDAEELYLRQIANHRGNPFPAQTDSMFAGLDQAGRIGTMRKKIEAEIGVDPATLPGYNPDGVHQAFGHGRLLRMRPDMDSDPEWKKFEKNYVLNLEITGSRNMPDVIDAILESGGVFAPTTDRMRRGIWVSSMSPKQDLDTGGASFSFARIKARRSVGKSPGVSWKASVLKRMDSISYDSDYYGKVNDGVEAIRRRRKTGTQGLRDSASRSSNETIFKGGLSLFDDLDSITVYTSAERQRILDVFQKHGWDKLPDGRSVDDIVKVVK